MDLLVAVTYKLQTKHIPLSCVFMVIIFLLPLLSQRIILNHVLEQSVRDSRCSLKQWIPSW